MRFPPSSFSTGSGNMPSADAGGAHVAQTGLVRRPDQSFTGAALALADPGGPPLSGRGSDPLPSAPQVQAGSLEPERVSLLAMGLPEDVVNTIQGSRASSTRTQYAGKWRVFSRWCLARNVDPVSCPVVTILSFLQGLLDAGQSPQSLKGYLATMAACHIGVDGRSVGSLPLVTRFMKGARRLRPPPRRFFPKWDLVTVMDGLSSAPFETLESMDLKHLSLKTALLLALASGKRVSDLTALSVQQSCMLVADDLSRITLRPNPAFQPKVLNANFRTMVIDLPAFSPPPFNTEEDRRLNALCPVRTLLAYVARTRHFRTTDQLLVCFAGGAKHGSALSKQRLSHWIVDAISLAYSAVGKSPPTDIKAHSTRGVATSWALFKGVSVEDMCAAASWSSHHTFVKYYSLDVAGSRFASAVLSSGV